MAPLKSAIAAAEGANQAVKGAEGLIEAASSTAAVDEAASRASRAARAYAGPAIKHSRPDMATLIKGAQQRFFSGSIELSEIHSTENGHCLYGKGMLTIKHNGAETPVEIVKTISINRRLETIEIEYKAYNPSNNKQAGSWEGVITDRVGTKEPYLWGKTLFTSEFGQNIKGLGTALKKLAEQDARAAGLDSIEISACGYSHVFHYKTGYRSNISTAVTAELTLNELKIEIEKGKTHKIAKDFLSEIEYIKYEIDLGVCNDKYIIQRVNNLIDKMLEAASQKGLRTQDIGLSGQALTMINKWSDS